MNTKRSILVIEAEEKSRRSFINCFRQEGCHVLEASTGRQALHLIRKHLPDLVLVNIHLPDSTGAEICRQIKSDATLGHIGVIVCWNETTSAKDKMDAIHAGTDDYLLQSSSPLELKFRIRTWLRLRATTAAFKVGEEHHRRLITILSDSVCLIKSDGRLLEVNPQTAAIFGYDEPKELLQKNLFEFAVKNDHDKIKADIANLLRGESGLVSEIEYTFRKKNGASFQAELSATPANIPGRPVELMVVLRDITERKQAEKVFRESEERFHQLANNIHEVFWITDVSKSNMIYVSPAYEEIWGHTCKSLYDSPRSWFKSIHPDDGKRVLESALTKQYSGLYHEVYRIIRPDGSIRWIQDRAFPIRNDSGKVFRIVGIAEDITKRKQAWDALAESEARKSAIMRVALDGIITIDQAGRIMELNSAAEKIFIQNRAKMIGNYIKEIITPSLRAWFQAGLNNCFTGEKGPAIGSRIEITALRADGSQFFAEFTIAQIKIEGHPTFAVYIRDITQRKRAELELRSLPQRIIEAQESERQRVARELHDGINQIIASVKMRLYKVAESLPDLKPAAKEILTRCDRLLVKAVEENRRIAQNLHPRDLDNLGLFVTCRNFCRELQSRTNLKVQSRFASLRKRLPPNMELNLFRIVQETVNNIEKHAHAKTVKLRIELQGKMICLKIQDDGCGFDPERSKAKKGHGLGLTNMRERALSIGATCEVSSSLKKGTTVIIRVPYPKKKD